MDPLTEFALTEPAPPPNMNDDAARFKWQQKFTTYAKRKEMLDSNLRTLYSLIWGQCSEALQNKIKEIPTFEIMNIGSDPIALLKAIRAVAYHFEHTKWKMQALQEAMVRFHKLRQARKETNAK